MCPIETLNIATMPYRVAVRAMCEFTAKEGDLDLRFTPSPSAQEGIAGHKVVTGRRMAGYESEISLHGQFQNLQVRGRADGYDPDANRLEEIKTHRGALHEMPANHRQLHWAQAKIYGWLLCQLRSLSQLNVALVYFDVTSQEETRLDAAYTAAELEAFFVLQCERFLHWATHELVHRVARNLALTALTFPHTAFRIEQRLLAEAVYRSAVGAYPLMAQAPTGIGKTIGTIFPVLKAMPGQAIDKIYFLTAKTSGQQAALHVLEQLGEQSTKLPLRIIEITARDKSCEHPGKACNGDSCPLAQGFYDRLPLARKQALQPSTTQQPVAAHLLTRQHVRSIALTHTICPYYLTQELTRWADVVIADYNYYFDASAMLFALAIANDWKIHVLVDEAHNLVERGRSMYSACLSQKALQNVTAHVPTSLVAPFALLERRWQELAVTPGTPYTVLPTIAAPFRAALQGLQSATTEFFAEDPHSGNHALLEFYFDALRFSRLADTFDLHSLFDASTVQTAETENQSDQLLHIRNIVPASFLKPRLSAAHSVTLFSATLNPQQFYRDALGVPERTAWIDVPSPFVAAQLSVQIIKKISTRFAHRMQSLRPIVDLMASQFSNKPGNYLAFFSSFDYLIQVSNLFAQQHPDIPIWKQLPNMDDGAKSAFLARFIASKTGIGFAVLGGAFSEGIDLPGDRLIGAFIATLGLPQFNPVNEQIMQRMEATFAAGYDYTYLYPGIRKVVQAAGRVIRTTADQGVVYLIDDRFARANVRALLPSWWEIEQH